MNIQNTKLPIRVKGIHYNENIMCFLVYISDICNYNCNYCYNIIPRTNKLLNLNYLYEYIDFYSKKSNKFIELELIGGEPLFNDNIFYFCEKIFKNNKNVKIKIYTNLSFDITKYIKLLKFNVMLIPSWHSIKIDLKNQDFIDKIFKLINLGYNKQLDIRIMYEPLHYIESLNAFDSIKKIACNIEFSLLVDKNKNENKSELYSYTKQQLFEFHNRVDALNKTKYKQEYEFLYNDGTCEYKCFNDLFGKNEYSFKLYLCDAKKNNLYIHFNGDVYPCVDYFAHNRKKLFNIHVKSAYKIFTKPILCELKRCTCDWSIAKYKIF